MKSSKLIAVAALVFAAWQPPLAATHTVPAAGKDLPSEVDAVVREVLAEGIVPSVSVAVVQKGRIVHVRAYGKARLSPDQPARSEMRYSIGSISKQFTAAAILLLAEDGKLKLDDPVSRFVPELSRAGDVTIRQVLSHTSGYRDYWPQDYVMPSMLEPVSARQILERWASKPLDFEPGTEWQYSNTGYVITGLVVERASGQALFEFLRRRIFTPLAMTSVLDVNAERLTESDAAGYMRYGLGRWRVAPKEGKGWLFAAGELAMTAEDLAKWDLSLIRQGLLKPESYRQLEKVVVLKNGMSSNYGLGLNIERSASHRMLSHGGAVSGFISHNVVFPDDQAAVVALSNGESEAAGSVCLRVAQLLLPERDTDQENKALQVLEALQHGKIDRSLFTANANYYFSEAAVRDLAGTLKPLGKVLSISQTQRQERGGMVFRAFEVKFRRKALVVYERTLPGGEIEQYIVGSLKKSRS